MFEQALGQQSPAGVSRAHDWILPLDRRGTGGQAANPQPTIGSAAQTSAAPMVFVIDVGVSGQSVKKLLAQGDWRVETCACAADVLSLPRLAVPSCLVLGLNPEGLALQERMSAERKEMPIIFVDSHADIPMAVQAMKGGAVDLLTEPLAGEALFASVQWAIERSRSVLREEMGMIALRGRHALLTRRECDVLRLVVSGFLNKQIGGELGISEITVKAHRGSVMRKMRAGSLAQLVRMAAQLGVAAVESARAGRTQMTT